MAVCWFGLPLALLTTCIFAADPPRATDPPAPASSTAPAKDTAITAGKSHRVHLGGISIGAGYSRYAGPFYGWPGYGFYNPFWFPMYAPYFYSPYSYTGFTQGPNMGEIKLRSPLPSAEVYLDGAYAGLASDLKNMWLSPGAYELELRAPDRHSFARRVYVLSGKTLRIQATLAPAAGEVKP